MYQFYLNEDLLPLPPQELSIQVNNQNSTVDLVSMGEVNLLKAIGLRSFSFQILLPGKPYPFLATLDDFKMPIYYLVKLRAYKENKTPIRLIIIRNLTSGDDLFETNLQVSIEDYQVLEKAGAEGDVQVELNLKEHRTPVVQVQQVQAVVDGITEITEEVKREEKSIPTTYTVVSGDTLWAIAKRQLNDGSRYKEIATLNDIQDPNQLRVGQVLRLP